MNDVSFLVAFLAGLASFISPCVLPLVPVYLTVLAGSQGSFASCGKKQILINVGFFVLGFTLIFVLIGISLGSLGSFLLMHSPVLEKIGGVLIILFGLHLSGAISFSFLNKTVSLRSKPDSKLGPLQSLVMGTVFSLGWSPCIGPILSSILIIAGTSGQAARGGILLSLYSLGLALPFFLTALLAQATVVKFLKIKEYAERLSKIAGVALIVLGLLLLFGLF